MKYSDRLTFTKIKLDGKYSDNSKLVVISLEEQCTTRMNLESDLHISVRKVLHFLAQHLVSKCFKSFKIQDILSVFYESKNRERETSCLLCFITFS